MALSALHHPAHEFEEGLTHLAGGRWEQAVECLRTAAQREPGRLGVVRALTTACLAKGDAEGARAAVGALTIHSPMCAEGWRLAAQLEWKLGRYDDSMALLARGLEQLPNSQVLHRQTLMFWGARGKMEESANHTERSNRSSWTPPATRLTSMNSIRLSSSKSVESSSSKSSEPAKREADWLDRVAQDTKLLESVLDSPGVGDDLEMLKGLEFRLSALLESQPYHADRQLGLARLQVKIDAMPAAMLSVQRALRANPDYVEAHRLRATILGKLGEYDSAIEVLEKLIKRGMDWADIHYQAAELQEARGRADEARSHLYSAIRLNPGFERAKRMLERWAA